MSLSDFFSAVRDSFGRRDSDGDDADRRFQARVALAACLGGAVGLAAGVFLIVLTLQEGAGPRPLRHIVGLPLLCGAAGFFFGLGLMCLFAPRAFLTGPQGRKWMKLIGTKSVLGARLACLILTLLLPAFIAVLVFFITQPNG